MNKIVMQLEKQAKAGGADRYAGKHEDEVVTFYVPQSIARKNGTPVPTVTITIDVA